MMFSSPTLSVTANQVKTKFVTVVAAAMHVELVMEPNGRLPDADRGSRWRGGGPARCCEESSSVTLCAGANAAKRNSSVLLPGYQNARKISNHWLLGIDAASRKVLRLAKCRSSDVVCLSRGAVVAPAVSAACEVTYEGGSVSGRCLVAASVVRLKVSGRKKR